MAQYKSGSYSWVNLNFRVRGHHAKIVHEAAALHKESAASFMRRVIIEWSAAELKLEAPDMSEYAGDIISNAAKQVGMTIEEFTKLAARESAARVLQQGVNGVPIETVERLSEELRARLAGQRLPLDSPHESGERKTASGGRRR